MDEQAKPTNGPPAAFQAESGEHIALSERPPQPAAGFQAESQEHAAAPAAND